MLGIAWHLAKLEGVCVCVCVFADVLEFGTAATGSMP